MSPSGQDIDPHDNPDVSATERDQTASVARAAGNGMGGTPTGSEPSESAVQATTGGTAGGDPLAGVTIDDHDLEDAVSGDTGPEHHGRR